MRSLNPWPIFPFNLDISTARSLSLQFTLQGVVDAFEQIQTLRSNLSTQNLDLQQILKGLKNLLLFSLENPFAQKGSILDKLCFYSEILIQAFQSSDENLLHILDEMRKLIMMIKSKMFVRKKMDFISLEREALLNACSSLHRYLCSFFDALFPFLKEARSNENILVQLIEYKEKLNVNLGTRSIETLLQKFFPAGLDQLRAVIHEGYTRRKFIHFLSTIEPLIDAIEWEMTCPHLS